MCVYVWVCVGMCVIRQAPEDRAGHVCIVEANTAGGGKKKHKAEDKSKRACSLGKSCSKTTFERGLLFGFLNRFVDMDLKAVHSCISKGKGKKGGKGSKATTRDKERWPHTQHNTQHKHNTSTKGGFWCWSRHFLYQPHPFCIECMRRIIGTHPSSHGRRRHVHAQKKRNQRESEQLAECVCVCVCVCVCATRGKL